MKTIIRVYHDKAVWRWKLRDARNGRVIGASTEGYSSRSACLRNLARVTGVSVRVSSSKIEYERTAYLSGRDWWPA